MPIRGMEPTTTEANIKVTSTGRMRWSLPNTTGLNRSTVPDLSSGQAGFLVSFMGRSPTQRISAPSWESGLGLGHTHASLRRSPDARALRFSITSSGVTP